MIAVSNHAVSVSIIVLVLFIAFLAVMGGLLVKLVVNTRKDGAGAASGCMLATGFGALTLLLAGLAFGASALTIGVAAGPDVVEETLSRLEDLEHRDRNHAEHPGTAHGGDARRAASSNDATKRESVRRELDAALDEAGRAYDDALETARAAGADAREDIRGALQEAAQAMREARETVREALREVHAAVRDEPARPAGPRMELRIDVTGDPGPALAELVERVVGTEPECVIAREEGGGTARWTFSVPQPPTEQVGALEDRLREELGRLELPAGVRVEFRDVVLQDRGAGPAGK